MTGAGVMDGSGSAGMVEGSEVLKGYEDLLSIGEAEGKRDQELSE